jgi:hypothetical protein
MNETCASAFTNAMLAKVEIVDGTVTNMQSGAEPESWRRPWPQQAWEGCEAPTGT